MIETVALDQLAPAVLANAPNVPDPALSSALRRSAREFCRQTQIWREWLGETDPVDGVFRYQVMAPMDAEFVAIVGTRPADLQDRIEVVSSGMYLTLDFPQVPSEPFDIQAAFMPTMDASSIPALLANEWDSALVAGALAFLMDIPKADWTDHNFAAHQAQIFNRGIARARMSRAKGQRNDALIVPARRFI